MSQYPSAFARKLASIYVFQAAAVVSAFLLSVVLARTLGPTGKGTVDLFVVIGSLIAQIGLLGMSYGFLYQVANRREPIQRVHGDAIIGSVGLGIVGVAVAILVPDAIASIVGDLPVGFAALALALAGFTAYSASWTMLMLGIDRAALSQLTQAAIGTGTLLVIVGLWLTQSLDVDTAVAAIAIASIIGAIARFILAMRLHRGSNPSPALSPVFGSLRYGLRLYPGSIANLLAFRLDQIVIGATLGVGGVGIYAISARWAELLWLVGYGLLNASVHRIAASRANEA